MTEMQVRVFEDATQVGYFDADVKLRMSPTAYWRVLQNAAAGHAAALSAATEELRRGGQTWMLSKMRLEVHRHPVLGERLTIETWPSTRIKGARAYRDFVLKDADGTICASASSLWVIVDLASRRPVRIPDAIVSLSIDPGYVIPGVQDAWLDPPVAPTASTGFVACWSDADQNEHVNNVTMVRWGVDALPLAFLERHSIRVVEAHYRAEVNIGDAVSVQTEWSGLNVRQAIVKGETLAAVIDSRWVESDAADVAP